jgi:hypothetical protein
LCVFVKSSEPFYEESEKTKLFFGGGEAPYREARDAASRQNAAHGGLRGAEATCSPERVTIYRNKNPQNR